MRVIFIFPSTYLFTHLHIQAGLKITESCMRLQSISSPTGREMGSRAAKLMLEGYSPSHSPPAQCTAAVLFLLALGRVASAYL